MDDKFTKVDEIKRRNARIRISLVITMASLFLPFKAVGNEIGLGYPLSFLTVFKSAFAGAHTGWHMTIFQLISFNILPFCLDVVVIYLVITTLGKTIKSKSKLKLNETE